MKNLNKKISLVLAVLCSASLYSQDWVNQTSGFSGTPMYRGGKVGIGTYYYPGAAGQWYGSTTTGPWFEVNSTDALGTTVNNITLMTSFGGSTNPSNMRHNTWLRRNATVAVQGWATASLHDGISIDNQFFTPGTNTKTWWERDPYNDIQSWGTSATTYMQLSQGKLVVNSGADALVVKDLAGNVNFKVKSTGVSYAREINVQLTAFPDYVFKKDYSLMSLENLAAYIQKNNHLPNVPSASEIKKNGADLGELSRIQMEKIEELTLYILELKKQVDGLQKQIDKK